MVFFIQNKKYLKESIGRRRRCKTTSASKSVFFGRERSSPRAMTARPVASLLHTPFAIVFIRWEPSHRGVHLIRTVYRPFLYAPRCRIPFIDLVPRMCIKRETLHTVLWLLLILQNGFRGFMNHARLPCQGLYLYVSLRNPTWFTSRPFWTSNTPTVPDGT